MKPRSRSKMKGRVEGGTFSLIPHAVQDSENWKRCSGTAIKLLCDLVRFYNGKNNGDLSVAMRLLRPKGWTRDETVGHAQRELRHFGLIVLTRQGGLNVPNLYALTWHPIDECGGKLDCPPTRVASGEWKQNRAQYKRPRKKKAATECGGTKGEIATECGVSPQSYATDTGAILGSAPPFAASDSGDLLISLPRSGIVLPSDPDVLSQCPGQPRGPDNSAEQSASAA